MIKRQHTTCTRRVRNERPVSFLPRIRSTRDRTENYKYAITQHYSDGLLLIHSLVLGGLIHTVFHWTYFSLVHPHNILRMNNQECATNNSQHPGDRKYSCPINCRQNTVANCRRQNTVDQTAIDAGTLLLMGLLYLLFLGCWLFT